MKPLIKLYGTERCHKTQYYKKFLDEIGQKFRLLDVEKNEKYAEELRALYENRKLNFPTITIDDKKLRNPSESDVLKWIKKKSV